MIYIAKGEMNVQCTPNMGQDMKGRVKYSELSAGNTAVTLFSDEKM